VNDAEIEGVVEELGQRVGVPFDNLWQPSRDRAVLGLKDGTLILMVPRGPGARLHTVGRRPPNPKRPFSFQGACRARLRGPLTDVSKHPGDRVVRLAFGPTALELRLTGRSGGLWLVDEAGGVIAAYDGPATELPPLAVRPMPPATTVRFARIGDETFNQAAERWFTLGERERERVERRARVEVGLKRAISRLRRLVANLGDDLARADRAPELRHQGDLLAANLHLARKGADHIEVDDWAQEVRVTVPLDPSKPASATLEGLYRQARRLDRLAEHVLTRMDAVQAELRLLVEAEARLDLLDADALAALEAKLPKTSSRGARAPGDVEVPWTTWIGPAGERVLVGRHEKGNRRLTFQVARGSDWWMHLRERPGAHLVIPVPKGQTPPLPLLLAAAQIALIHGRVAPGDSAEVQYTRIRDVRSLPGEGARVTLTGERVLRVARDPAALAGWAPDS
jgi:predicted ribosome quality control (RQC) complex YloA/Tae2 family protein